MKGSKIVSKTSTLPYWAKFDMKKKACVIANKFCSNIQLWMSRSKKYIEIANNRRGAVPEINPGAITIYDVSTSPKTDEYEDIVSGCFDIFREQIVNNLYTLEHLVQELQKDGFISKNIGESSYDNYANYYKDFIEFLKNKGR